MEEAFDEDLKDQKEIKTIGTNQSTVSKKALVNMINQQVINKYPNHDYVDLQLLDYGVDKSMTSKQNFVDLMTQHGLEGVYKVDNTKSSNLGVSSELPSATSTQLFGQQVFIVAHVNVSVILRR